MQLRSTLFQFINTFRNFRNRNKLFLIMRAEFMESSAYFCTSIPDLSSTFSARFRKMRKKRFLCWKECNQRISITSKVIPNNIIAFNSSSCQVCKSRGYASIKGLSKLTLLIHHFFSSRNLCFRRFCCNCRSNRSRRCNGSCRATTSRRCGRSRSYRNTSSTRSWCRTRTSRTRRRRTIRSRDFRYIFRSTIDNVDRFQNFLKIIRNDIKRITRNNSVQSIKRSSCGSFLFFLDIFFNLSDIAVYDLNFRIKLPIFLLRKSDDCVAIRERSSFIINISSNDNFLSRTTCTNCSNLKFTSRHTLYRIHLEFRLRCSNTTFEILTKFRIHEITEHIFGGLHKFLHFINTLHTEIVSPFTSFSNTHHKFIRNGIFIPHSQCSRNHQRIIGLQHGNARIIWFGLLKIIKKLLGLHKICVVTILLRLERIIRIILDTFLLQFFLGIFSTVFFVIFRRLVVPTAVEVTDTFTANLTIFIQNTKFFQRSRLSVCIGDISNMSNQIDFLRMIDNSILNHRDCRRINLSCLVICYSSKNRRNKPFFIINSIKHITHVIAVTHEEGINGCFSERFNIKRSSHQTRVCKELHQFLINRLNLTDGSLTSCRFVSLLLSIESSTFHRIHGFFIHETNRRIIYSMGSQKISTSRFNIRNGTFRHVECDILELLTWSDRFCQSSNILTNVCKMCRNDLYDRLSCQVIKGSRFRSAAHQIIPYRQIRGQRGNEIRQPADQSTFVLILITPIEELHYTTFFKVRSITIQNIEARSILVCKFICFLTKIPASSHTKATTNQRRKTKSPSTRSHHVEQRDTHLSNHLKRTHDSITNIPSQRFSEVREIIIRIIRRTSLLSEARILDLHAVRNSCVMLQLFQFPIDIRI